MRRIYKIKLFFYVLADDIGITMLHIKPARAGCNRIGSAANVYAVTTRGFQFYSSPVLFGFCSFVHMLSLCA